MAPHGPSRARLGTGWRHAGALSLLALVGAVYGGSLAHDFAFDDWQLVIDNEVVTWPLSRALDLFDPSSPGISYRPVRMFSYMVDHAIGRGLDPWVFHATNLAYHAAAVLVLYALAWQTIGSGTAAWFTAALFAVHPLGSEAVAYVAGRRDVLAGLFSLLALLSWWSFCGRAGHGAVRVAALVGSLVAAVLALGSKENAVVLPALALLLFVVRARRRSPSSPVAWGTWAALLASAVALGVVVDLVYGQRVGEAVARLRSGPLAPQPALSLRVLGQYGWLSVWPLHLYADYRPPSWPLPTTALDPPAILSGVVLGSMLMLGGLLVWRGRIAGAGLLWFPLALLPVAQIVPYREVVAEHNAYLPLAGLALVAGEAVALLGRRWPRGVLALGLVVVGLLAARAHARAAVWADDETLWSATLEERPESVRAKLNLAVTRARSGRLEDARLLLERARRQVPANLDVLFTLASVYGRLGDDHAAIVAAERAVEVEPGARTLTFLAWANVAAGSEAAARQAFQRALGYDPRNRDARRGLAELRERDRQRRHLRYGRSR